MHECLLSLLLFINSYIQGVLISGSWGVVKHSFIHSLSSGGFVLRWFCPQGFLFRILSAGGGGGGLSSGRKTNSNEWGTRHFVQVLPKLEHENSFTTNELPLILKRTTVKRWSCRITLCRHAYHWLGKIQVVLAHQTANNLFCTIPLYLFINQFY